MDEQQLYFEDVNEGDDLSSVLKENVSLHDVVRWCSAADNYTDFHYDEAYAKSLGFPNMLVPGPLLGAYLMTRLTNWMGEQGTLKKLTQRNVGMTFPGESVHLKAQVRAKYVELGEHFVEVEYRLEKKDGESTNTGKALVTLPARTSS